MTRQTINIPLGFEHPCLPYLQENNVFTPSLPSPDIRKCLNQNELRKFRCSVFGEGDGAPKDRGLFFKDGRLLKKELGVFKKDRILFLRFPRSTHFSIKG